ncbi:MAG: diphthamide synthesis protein [Nanoarchaeota archaeon]
MTLYHLELEKAIAKIQETKAKVVCIQLPDGLKSQAADIEREISEKTGARVLIWLGSNFGACDIPLGLNRLGVELFIAWGHAPFHKKEGW